MSSKPNWRSVTLADLKTRHPNAREEILQEAVRLIVATNIDHGTIDDFIFWGHEYQKNYGDFLSRALTVGQSETYWRVIGYVARTIDIIKSIDIKRVCGVEPLPGVLERFFRNKSKKSIDSLPEFVEAQKELLGLVDLMNRHLDSLRVLKIKLEDISSDIDELADTVEVYVIVSVFFAEYDYQDPTRAGFKELFADRGMSLTQTLVQIRTGALTRRVHFEQPLRLIQTIQHTALVQLPLWLSSVIATTTMLEASHQPPVTKADEISQQAQGIISQFEYATPKIPKITTESSGGRLFRTVKKLCRQ